MRKFVASVALATAVVVGSLVAALPAKASNYNVEFIGNGYDINAAITTSGPLGGGEAITSMTGSITGPQFGTLALQGVASSGAQTSADNLYLFDNLYIASSFADYNGWLFNFGGFEGNIYSNPDGGQLWLSVANANGYVNGDGGFGVEIFPTPLPAALPLFASGLGAMGLFGWRRKRKNAVALATA